MKFITATLLAVVVLSGCVSTNATLLGSGAQRTPVLPENVALYRTADQVRGEYEEVALLNSSGSSTATNEAAMFESMRKKAGESVAVSHLSQKDTTASPQRAVRASP